MKEPGIRSGLSQNLSDLLRELEEQLPDMDLQSSEIRRLSATPISTSLRVDVYEGLYLERRKVSIRELRTATVNDRTLRVSQILLSPLGFENVTFAH